MNQHYAHEHHCCLLCCVIVAGIYLFFVFFGLVMLLLLLITGSVRLWVEGYVPKIVLVARAHSMPLSSIFLRVLARR